MKGRILPDCLMRTTKKALHRKIVSKSNCGIFQNGFYSDILS